MSVYHAVMSDIAVHSQRRLREYSAIGVRAASPATRLSYLAVLALIGIFSIGTYIFSVNAIMLDGKAIQDRTVHLRSLQEQTSGLTSQIAAVQSPAWLEEASATLGLVAVGEVSFLDVQKTFALSRPPQGDTAR